MCLQITMKNLIFFLFVKVAILLATIPTSAYSLRLDKTQYSRLYGSRQSNVSLQQSWLTRFAIPYYLKDFSKILHKAEETSVTTLTELFDGVTSESCKGHVAEWFWRVNPENLENIASDKEKWVLQMVDAWGKLPEGILAGHINSYGDFDECVQIQVDDLQIRNDSISSDKREKSFAGKYCTSYILPYEAAISITPKPPGQTHLQRELKGGNSIHQSFSLEDLLKHLLGLTPAIIPLIPSVGVCFPSSCSTEDVQQILMNGLHMMYSTTLPETDPATLPWPVTYDCKESQKPSLDGSAIVMIIIIGTFIVLTIIAGITDYWRTNFVSKDAPQISSKPYKYFMAFSFYTNLKKTLSTRRSAGDLGCLHGIRFLSTAWVILAHTLGTFSQGPQWNLVDILNIYKDWTILAVLNGGFAVDTFFVMSGMLVTYNILKMLEKNKGKINIIMLYVHRYIRLTPTYAILIGIAATLLNYAGNGPQWSSLQVQESWCRKNWWTNLLYINNVVNPDEMCYAISWYLANDMQFFILAPFIVYPIWRWKMMGGILLVVYTILSCIAPVLVVRYAEDAPPAMIIGKQGKGLAEIYDRPWSRINAFLVGVWLGWLLDIYRGKRINLPRTILIAFWLTSTGIALALIFAIYPWYVPTNEIPTVSGYFYAGLSRFSWGVAVSWVIFACVKGYGGIIDRFLSWKVFIPLGRLCFCAYLTSHQLQSIFHTRLTVPIKWDRYTVMNIFFAHMVMSFMVALFCTLLFESPFITLQKLIFENNEKKQNREKSAGQANIDVEKNNNMDVNSSIKLK